jgi:hypothetical protein
LSKISVLRIAYSPVGCDISHHLLSFPQKRRIQIHHWMLDAKLKELAKEEFDEEPKVA